MPYMIDSIEDRLRYQVGDLMFQIQILQTQLDEKDKEITDLKARLEDE